MAKGTKKLSDNCHVVTMNIVTEHSATDQRELPPATGAGAWTAPQGTGKGVSSVDVPHCVEGEIPALQRACGGGQRAAEVRQAPRNPSKSREGDSPPRTHRFSRGSSQWEEADKSEAAKSKKLYQPVRYTDNGTNIEYGDMPEELSSFHAFLSRAACIIWLRDFGYDPDDFAILEYDEGEIEEPTIIEDW